MGPERGTLPLIAALLAAIWLTGCVSSLSNAGDSLGANGQVMRAAPATNAASDRVIKTAANDGAASSSGDGYTIGPSDVLDISVFKVPELSKTLEVAPTGTINFPLVGEIPAMGKTPQQLERDLTAKLGAKYLQNPQVTVLVKESNSQKVAIQGAVEKPGVYPLKGKTTLLELVAMAGGLKQSSDSTVLILRNNQGKRAAAKFDVSAIQNGKAEDPPVQSGDVIVAGTSAIKEGFNAVLKVLPVAGMFSFLY
jgi:polysaccharide biosynthesis/export protein